MATDDTADTDEDTALNYIAVLTNDTDVNGDSLSVSSVGSAGHGTVTNNNDGTINYTPNANYNGPDSFSYTVSDGNGGTDTATVNLTINAVNDAPVAVADANSVDEDQPLSATAPGVLDNDEDVDSSSLKAVLVDDVDSGELKLNTDGSYTYTSDANFNGEDSFTYKANDGSLDSNEVTVSITVTAVNDAPVGTVDAFTTDEDTDLTVSAANGLLKNDTDIEHDTLHVADADANTPDINPVSGPSHGQLTLNADGSFTYVPDADYNGSDSFTYRVCDNGSPQKCSVETAKVNVTINAVNDAPVTVDDSLTTNEDTAGNGNVLTNDTDVDNANLTAVVVAGASHGQLTLNADGSYTYTPSNNFFGSDSFTYKANDGSLASNTATVNITVTAVNDAPTAAAQSVTTNEDTGKQITLGANDVDGDALTYTIVSAPAHGTLSGTGANQTYTPDLNYNGSDSFTFKANDGTIDSNVATVSITVNAVNDAPTVTLASGGSCSTSTTSVSGTMNLALADVDSSGVLTLSATSSNQALVPAANVKLGGSGATRTVSITPAAKKSGSATITITASDGTDKSTTTIQVIVGTDKKETIPGTDASDMIFGLNGDDTINAGKSNDLVCGGNGGGVINGGAGDDTLDGGNGNDTLRGDDGNDILRGGQGNDRLEGGNNDDTLTGGSGTDGFDGGSGTDVATDYNAAEGDTRTNIP